MKKSNNKLKYTGERMDNNPGSADYIVGFERYKFSSNFVKNKVTLDFSCGVGYGSNQLSELAKKVVGVDVQAGVIEYCKKRYKKNNLSFKLIDPNGNLCEDLVGKFDAIVSLETIEHVNDQKLFLNNLKKYLKGKKSSIILSTPNNFNKINPPVNKFHIYEFDILELRKVLIKIFPNFKIDLYGQGRTGIHREDELVKPKVTPLTFIIKLLNWVWILDYKSFNFFRKIDHLSLYKKIGSLQRHGDSDYNIYKINYKGNFENPITSIYVLSKS
jgi:2-polyprenyl-3-methyl-5-hydroxy-6-metoxy-1,4-benzoquinol methylase